jgi:hypothetical protein
MTDDLSPAEQLRITLTAEIPHEEGQEYTAVEMLLAVANGLKLQGAVPSMLRLEIAPPCRAEGLSLLPFKDAAS